MEITGNKQVQIGLNGVIRLVFIVTACLSSAVSQYSGIFKPSLLYERTAEDPEVVANPFGVPVDFSYNETTEVSNWPWHLNSVPGCPKSIDGHPWVYYGNPRRCYLAGSRGPCSGNDVILLEMFSPYGVCACDCLRNRFDHGDEEVVSSDGRYMFCSPHSYKPLVWDKMKKKCYNLNERGPCGVHDRLIKDPTGKYVRCVPRCDPPYFYDWWDERCRKYSGQPWSGPWPSNGGGSSSIQTSRCSYDERYSAILRRCLKVTGRGSTPGLIIG